MQPLSFDLPLPPTVDGPNVSDLYSSVVDDTKQDSDWIVELNALSIGTRFAVAIRIGSQKTIKLVGRRADRLAHSRIRVHPELRQLIRGPSRSRCTSKRPQVRDHFRGCIAPLIGSKSALDFLVANLWFEIVLGRIIDGNYASQRATVLVAKFQRLSQSLQPLDHRGIDGNSTHDNSPFAIALPM
jgi:hypothetical protein